jgi:hypothetical protein
MHSLLAQVHLYPLYTFKGELFSSPFNESCVLKLRDEVGFRLRLEGGTVR